MLTFCQGNSGNGVGIIGSACCIWFMLHSKQFLTFSSRCFEIPGHQIDCLALVRHLVMPR